MKITIETAIQTIAQKAMLAEDSADAMRFAQAVQNLANALFTIHSAEQAQRSTAVGMEHTKTTQILG